jgi:heptosyltransferase-3
LGFLKTWNLDQARVEFEHGAGVLVVASTALGDSLLTTPLISALAGRLGRERVGILVKRGCEGLYEGDPRIGRVFTVAGKHRGCRTLSRELQKSPYKIALMANFTEPDLIPWLWWGGIRGFLRYRSRWTRYPKWIANQNDLRKPGDADYATGHAIENNLAMATALGLVPTTRLLSLPYLRTADSESSALAAEAGLSQPYILIHPGASRPNKRWPIKNWAGLVQRLCEQNVAIGMTGSSGESALVQEILGSVNRPENVVNLAGQLSLVQLAHLQRTALMFVSGDTGPYHLALAIGCPTLTLFAPTDRGSSLEACGPHQADPAWHRTLATAQFGDSIETISLESVAAESIALLSSSRQVSTRSTP